MIFPSSFLSTAKQSAFSVMVVLSSLTFFVVAQDAVAGYKYVGEGYIVKMQVEIFTIFTTS